MPIARRFRRLALASLLCLPRVLDAAIVPSVFGGRIACAPAASGVQFCAGNVATRVETFDGVPLDVNVTLPPASMDGPFPLIVDLHGWSLGKTQDPYVAWAEAGYVVLSYTARGFHFSCGSVASRAPDAALSNPTVCNERGWIRLADVRYEAHDTQHLAGLLADEGLVVPTKIGVTGASYGGGQSMILAALRNRVMLPDGTLVPWKSPMGADMTIAAAAPLIPWSDLAYSLTPNGRTLDYRTDNPYGTRGGVQKQSWNAVLYSIGGATGFYSPIGVDFASDIQSWNARVSQGEPYDGDATLEAILAEITAHHSAYYVDDSVEPAPLFIYNAWTDDLFPVDETVRFWRKTIAKYPTADISFHYADDFGHSRASLGFTGTAVIDLVTKFFDRHLHGHGEALPKFEATTQGCNGAGVEGPFTADDWDALQPAEVRYTAKGEQRFDGAGGKPENAVATDPLQVALGPCRTVAADDDPGAATYRLPAATGDGYTLLGSPTVIADFATSGPNAQIVGRLWDVAPSGMQTLVAQAVYRPRTDNRGPQVFQLHPNAWRFAGGHVPKLELLGQSSGYVRPSNGEFTVTVSGLELRLPVHEPANGKLLKAPSADVLPPGEPESAECSLAPLGDDCFSGSASLSLRSGTSSHLDWRLKATLPLAVSFGDPTATGYRLCVYDGGGRLAAAALAPAGSVCGKRACWKRRGHGFRYADHSAATGVSNVDLTLHSGRRSLATSYSLRVVGRGPHLGMGALPLADGPVVAQLVSDGTFANCWTSTFASPRRNSARAFSASR
jgi:predicted acyl esterase